MNKLPLADDGSHESVSANEGTKDVIYRNTSTTNVSYRLSTALNHHTVAGIAGTKRKMGKRKRKNVNCGHPSCSGYEASKHSTMSRNRLRSISLEAAKNEINRVAGGEPRKIRRAMARDLAKRMGFRHLSKES